MPKTKSGTEIRFRGLWTLLRWQGRLRNSTLQALFKVQRAQASRLIAEFGEINPSAILEERSDRSWRINSERAAIENGGDLAEMLALYRSAGIEPPTWIVEARIDFAPPGPKILTVLSDACQAGTGVSLNYGSMTQSGIESRTVFPHSIVRLSQRWHVRAWCATRKDYRDFALGRIKKAVPVSEQLSSTVGEDRLWNEILEVRVVPHSKLSAEASETIRTEYFSGASARRLEMRAALVPYLLQEARISTSKTQVPPEYLLEVQNIELISPLLFR